MVGVFVYKTGAKARQGKIVLPQPTTRNAAGPMWQFRNYEK